MATDPKSMPHELLDADARLAFDREKWADEVALRSRELKIKEADAPSAWKSPLVVAIFAAAVAALGNAGVSLLNARNETALERVKAEQTLIIEAIKTGGDVDKAAANLKFLVDTKLVTDSQRQTAIHEYLEKNKGSPDLLPSLPAHGASAEEDLYGVIIGGSRDIQIIRNQILRAKAKGFSDVQIYKIKGIYNNVILGPSLADSKKLIDSVKVIDQYSKGAYLINMSKWCYVSAKDSSGITICGN